MTTATATKQRTAIGIVRVSQTNGREGDSFASPEDQRDRITDECERRALRLIGPPTEELDVSGTTPLDRRKGLRGAVEAIEAGEAQVLVVAYFDRLCRSLRVQDEVVSRVESAGGQVLTVDVGEVTNGSAGKWLSGTLLGAVNEYVTRIAAEKSGEAQQRAIARGVAPWPSTPPGYLRPVVGHKNDGRPEYGKLVPDPETEPVVVKAFEMRADGATIAEVREYLRDQGIERSYHGTQALLASKVLLGELHFGDYEPNLTAHEPIVDRDLWNAVQRARVSRGRRAKSDRLLARLGVLRCETCGAAMAVGSAHHGKYHLYRCPPTGDCERRVTISAELVEGIVSDYVKAKIADVEGEATAEALALNAIAERDAAQAKLDAGIRTLAELTDEPATIETITRLRAARDEAQDEVDRLGGESVVERVRGADDWDKLTLSERRDLIKIHAPRVTVAPGRGAERVTIQPLGE